MNAGREAAIAVSRALNALERKAYRRNEMVTRVKALSGDPEAIKSVRKWDAEDGAKPFPLYLPDGSDVKSVSEVAALLGTTVTVAAKYVLHTKDASASLRLEAKDVLTTNKSDMNGIALLLLPKEEDRIWVTGMGEVAQRPHQMHVTLGYFGDSGEQQPFNNADLINEARRISGVHKPFDARVSSITRFNGEEKDPVVALLDAPQFEDIRKTLMSGPMGKHLDRTHGFVPHMTLGYIAKKDKTPEYHLPGIPIKIARLTAGYGPSYTTYPLGKTEVVNDMISEMKSILSNITQAK